MDTEDFTIHREIIITSIATQENPIFLWTSENRRAGVRGIIEEELCIHILPTVLETFPLDKVILAGSHMAILLTGTAPRLSQCSRASMSPLAEALGVTSTH